MRAAFALITALCLIPPAFAQEVVENDVPDVVPDVPALIVLEAVDTLLEDHLWASRPIVIFADTPLDPRFQEQLSLLQERPGPLIERDVIVILDADPDARSDARMTLRPRGFSMVILQRDGHVALRKPTPWTVREIMRAIDNLPLRVEEMGLTQ